MATLRHRDADEKMPDPCVPQREPHKPALNQRTRAAAHSPADADPHALSAAPSAQV